jgi:hypothetical protein
VRDKVAGDCEVVRGPRPVPPPPPSPPPPPAPGAPATYVFGPELSGSQQALVRRGLDAGARYYRSVLGRELPPFTVWAYADLEAMIRAYAESRPTSLDDARRFWEGGQDGHALTRKVWLGPRWFSNPPVSALKIAAHEAFHLLQYELVGERPLSVSGLDEIPPAGPWWLAEGTAEYFAYLASQKTAQRASRTSGRSGCGRPRRRARRYVRSQRSAVNAKTKPPTTSTLWRQSCCSAAAIRSSCLRTTKRLPVACHGQTRSRQCSAGHSTRSRTSSRRFARVCQPGSEASTPLRRILVIRPPSMMYGGQNVGCELAPRALRAERQKLAAAVAPEAPALLDRRELVDCTVALLAPDSVDFLQLASAHVVGMYAAHIASQSRWTMP